ncbi:MAG: TolC family protein [Bacteroidota bacterium]
MKYSAYLLCFAISFTIITSKGQSIQDDIPCDLSNVAEMLIDRNPELQRQRYRILQSRANRQTATSAFDYRLLASLTQTRGQQNLFSKDDRFESTNGLLETQDLIYSSGLQRTFRTGLTSTLSVDYSRLSNNSPFDQFGDATPANTAENFTTLNLSLSQPLIQGRGKKFTAAFENAAAKEIESSELNLTFISSNELYLMSLAYWAYYGSYQRLEIFKENEKRVRRVLEITEELVEADRKARNELLQIQADLVNQERQTLQAQQELYDARQNLGRQIGLEVGESTRLGQPTDPFPEVEGSDYNADLQLERFLELARDNRADLQALIKSREALEIDFARAQNNLKPRLDLTGSFSYGGVDAGNEIRRAITPLSAIPGRNVQFGLGLNFQFPLNNNAAQADLLRTKTALSDQQVVIDNQIRNIELNISIALNNLNNSVLRLDKAQQTLQFYQEVFEAEQVKFQNGLTTLLNLILFQERLTLAQLDFLTAQQEFAGALVNLRNETGTLLPIGALSKELIDFRSFYQIPD